jgi:hypothetical protein
MDTNDRRWPPRQKAGFSGFDTIDGPVLDMTAEGAFREPPPTPLADQLVRVGVVAAVVVGAAAVAALALWLALTLIPIALAAGAVAYLAYRWQVWRAGSRGAMGHPAGGSAANPAGASVGRQRDLLPR